MDWNFSIGWFMLGVIIFIAGGAIIYFYRQIAENFANGVSSYEKTKLFGLVTIAIGFLVMANLHTALLSFLVYLITPNK